MIARLRAFGRFWYDFVVGDDWRVAAGVLLTLAITTTLTATHLNAWWLPPTAVALLLPLSLRRAVHPPPRAPRKD